jgi:hypothetical protein
MMLGLIGGFTYVYRDLDSRAPKRDPADAKLIASVAV